MGIEVLLGCVGMIILHIGIGFQKKGVAAISNQGPEEPRGPGFRVWIGGTALTVVGAVGNYFALSNGLAASTLAVFSGLGLLALVLFAQKYLEESVGKAESGALVLILLGTVLGGLPAPTLAKEGSPLTVLWIVTGVCIVIGVSAELFGKAYRRELIQGLLSGIFGGLSFNAQKELTEAAYDMKGLQALSLFVVMTIAAFSFMNLAFRKEKAITLVPLGASCSMIAAVIFGYGVQGEVLTLARLSGMGATLLGIAVMTRGALKEEAEAS